LRSLGVALDEGDLGDALTAIVPASELLEGARPAPPRLLAIAPPELRPPARPTRSPTRALRVSAGALSLFADCPRRYRLRHLLGLEEPRPLLAEEDLSPEAFLDEDDEPRPSAGAPLAAREPIDDLPLPVSSTSALTPRVRARAAHRVIERWPLAFLGEATDIRVVRERLLAEGLAPDHDLPAITELVAELLGSRFAGALREADELHRASRFVLPIETSLRGVRTLLLAGTVDLVIRRGELIELVDLVLAPPRADISAHERRLRASALAAQRRNEGALVRAGLLFLGGEPSPIWLQGGGPDDTLRDEEHARFEAELSALAQRFAEARYHDRFDPVIAASCRALGCGFLDACHGSSSAR
jgi:ATP-dependent helicase/nuclease subunit A